MPLGFYSENEIFWGTMLAPNRSPGLLFWQYGPLFGSDIVKTGWEWETFNKIIAMDIWCLERQYLFYWFTNIRSDKKKPILRNVLFLHKRGEQVTAQLLGNMATKDMVWKYLLCTSLQDVQKIQWISRNFLNPKITLQCFKFGAQESKRIARFAMCWMFCVF